MKKLLGLLTMLLMMSDTAYANPACMVCTVAIGASLEIARSLGVPDTVVGLWAGALLTLVGYWTILFFNKKGWYFKGRDILLLALSVGMVGFIYVKEVVYTPKVIWQIFYLEEILFAALLGMILFIYTEKLYDFMKKRNGGHAHFPFEKVVLPVAVLSVFSLYFSYFPL